MSVSTTSMAVDLGMMKLAGDPSQLATIFLHTESDAVNHHIARNLLRSLHDLLS